MKEQIFESREYLEDYLPWATTLISGKPAEDLMNQARTDRDSIIKATVLFQPPLNRLTTAELTLPAIIKRVRIKQASEDGSPKFVLHEKIVEGEDNVELIADFELAQLNTLTISSLKNYLVVLNPRSSRWPVQFREDAPKEKNVLIQSALSRQRAETLVIRTSAALLKHVVHREAVGVIPEESLDWTIDEGIMQKNVLNALLRAGIETYGDLGIQSINQLKKIDGLGVAAIEDIKADLNRRGWLSPAFK